MREFVTLSVTSFEDTGGEHLYGRLEVATKDEWSRRVDGTMGWIGRGGFGVERHPHDRAEITRVLGGKEAAYLNRKDQGGVIFRPSRSLKRGDRTMRFNDAESLEAAAVALFRELFDDTDLLAVEIEPFSDDHRPLAGPPEIVAALSAVRGYSQQHDLLVSTGYLRKPVETMGEPVDGAAIPQPEASGPKDGAAGRDAHP